MSKIGQYAVHVEEDESGRRRYFIVGPSGVRIGRSFASLAEACNAAAELDRQHGDHQLDDSDTELDDPDSDDGSSGGAPLAPRG